MSFLLIGVTSVCWSEKRDNNFILSISVSRKKVLDFFLYLQFISSDLREKRLQMETKNSLPMPLTVFSREVPTKELRCQKLPKRQGAFKRWTFIFSSSHQKRKRWISQGKIEAVFPCTNIVIDPLGGTFIMQRWKYSAPPSMCKGQKNGKGLFPKPRK